MSVTDVTLSPNLSPSLTPDTIIPSPVLNPTDPAKVEPAKTPESAKVDPPKAVEPLKLEALKFPDAVKADDPTRGEFLGIVNDEKLDPAGRAQALLDLYGKVLTEASKAGSQAWDEQQVKWEAEAKADPVIGGEKLEPALGNISKLIDQYSLGADGKADPEMAAKLREAMDLTGAGNHPIVTRFLAGLAKQLVAEGAPVPARTPGGSERTHAQILYPDMKQ